MAPPEHAALPPERLPRRLDAVRFYVDVDLLPVGHALTWVRTDTIVCGAELIADDLPRGTPDLRWIPMITARGWMAVTGNDRIRRNPEESKLSVEYRLRAVCVQDTRGDLTMWQKLSLIVRHWDAVERFAYQHHKGPWWLSVTASGPRELPYSAMRTR